MIVPLNLPTAPLKLSRKDGKVFVWCDIRRKKILCTPEEWVRQHVVHFLSSEFGIGFGLMSTEYRLNYNGRLKRADIVVFNPDGEPWLIVECKAPDIAVTEETFFQITQYQKEINASVLMLTNGINHVYAAKRNGEFEIVDHLEKYTKEQSK